MREIKLASNDVFHALAKLKKINEKRLSEQDRASLLAAKSSLEVWNKRLLEMSKKYPAEIAYEDNVFLDTNPLYVHNPAGGIHIGNPHTITWDATNIDIT